MSKSKPDVRIKTFITYPQSLQKYMAQCSITDETLHEVLNHPVLDLITKLFKFMIKKKAKYYKEIGSLLGALSLHLEMFNATAVAKAFSQLVLTFLRTAPESIVTSILQFMIQLVGA